MSEQPPPRLLDAGPSLLRAALRGARADVPDPSHAEALRTSIAKAIADLPPPGGGGEGGGTPDAGGGAGSLTTVKLATIGGLATAVAIGAAVVVSHAPDTTVAPPPSSAQVARTAAATTSAPIGGFGGTTPNAIASASVEPVLDVHALPSARPAESVAPRPRVAPAVTSAPPVEGEMAILDVAQASQASLATAPATTLAKCDEHARLYPRGLHAEEREVLAIDALVHLGRRSDAEARAARFRAAYPQSAALRRIDTILAK